MPTDFETRKSELEQKVKQAAKELLEYTLAEGFSLPLDDRRFVAVGTPEYLAKATDTSGMQPSRAVPAKDC